MVITPKSNLTLFPFSSARLILLHKTLWFNHILGTLDGLGQPHTGNTRQTGSTTYWRHWMGWVNHILGTLDGLGQPHTGYTRRAGASTSKTGLPDYISSAGLYLCTRQLKYCTVYSSHIKHVQYSIFILFTPTVSFYGVKMMLPNQMVLLKKIMISIKLSHPIKKPVFCIRLLN